MGAGVSREVERVTARAAIQCAAKRGVIVEDEFVVARVAIEICGLGVCNCERIVLRAADDVLDVGDVVRGVAIASDGDCCIDVDGERERHGVEVERVATFARVLGDGVVAPTIVEGIHVIARAADECVVTKSTVEGVVTRVADERVIAIAARRALDIDERAADVSGSVSRQVHSDCRCARGVAQCVVAALAVERAAEARAFVEQQEVVARAAVEGVVNCASDREGVNRAAALQRLEVRERQLANGG